MNPKEARNQMEDSLTTPLTSSSQLKEKHNSILAIELKNNLGSDIMLEHPA